MRPLPSLEHYVADTHAIVWHITSSHHLSTEARRRFLAADRGDAVVYVSAITPVEIHYLQEKGRIAEIYDKFRAFVAEQPDQSYQVVPITYELSFVLSQVPYKKIPEMPDRIITATAFHLGLPLITKDERIRDWEGVVTVW